MGVGDIVDAANALNLLLCHRAKDVASDAPEAVDTEVSHE
jgi:hypothetical protein